MRGVIFFLFFCISFPGSLAAQYPDSAAKKTDSVISLVPASGISTDTTQALLLTENNLLNSRGIPVSLAPTVKKQKNKDVIFYVLTGVILMLAFFRFLFARYFTNLFRVFFNTSLRQSQLTDQLLQAKLPSLFFNLFFVISSGLYSYFLLVYFEWLNEENRWLVIGICITALGLIYFFKFCILKFTGWVTGYREETNTYLFILFLINKIIGIFLVPFIVLMAFSDHYIVKIAVFSSLAIIGILLLMRFYRSYGLLQNKLKISKFHFFTYIIGMELLPLMLLYKGLLILLNKNL